MEPTLAVVSTITDASFSVYRYFQDRLYTHDAVSVERCYINHHLPSPRSSCPSPTHPSPPAPADRYARGAWGVTRVLLFLANNLYAIPAYLVWMAVLAPLNWLAPAFYWALEGFMFHSLVQFAGVLSYTAGFDREYGGGRGAVRDK